MKKLNLKKNDKKKIVWAGILILLAVGKDLICSLLPEGSRADFWIKLGIIALMGIVCVIIISLDHRSD